MESLSRGRYTSAVECFNAKINKYCPKRVKYSELQQPARIFSCKNDWNKEHGCDLFENWRWDCLEYHSITDLLDQI